MNVGQSIHKGHHYALSQVLCNEQKIKDSQRDEHKSERNTEGKATPFSQFNEGEDKTPEICFKY